MVDPNTISMPNGPVRNAASMSQVARHLQGHVRCLLATVVNDAACKRTVSGSRVLCMPCRTRLLAAGVPELRFMDGRQVVDVDANEATLIDRLSRIV